MRLGRREGGRKTLLTQITEEKERKKGIRKEKEKKKKGRVEREF